MTNSRKDTFPSWLRSAEPSGRPKSFVLVRREAIKQSNNTESVEDASDELRSQLSTKVVLKHVQREFLVFRSTCEYIRNYNSTN
jgi:hypothetical protein